MKVIIFWIKKKWISIEITITNPSTANKAVRNIKIITRGILRYFFRLVIPYDRIPDYNLAFITYEDPSAIVCIILDYGTIRNVCIGI